MRDDLLIQEQLPRDALYGWRMLVCCLLLNQTHGRQVRPIVGALFARWPTPYIMSRAGMGLEAMVMPLGLWRRRAALLRRLSAACARPGYDPRGFRGCGVGAYALDSWKIFVEGRIVRRPRDGKLREYARRMGWTRTKHSKSGGTRNAGRPTRR